MSSFSPFQRCDYVGTMLWSKASCTYKSRVDSSSHNRDMLKVSIGAWRIG